MPLAKRVIFGGSTFITDARVDMLVLQLLNCNASMSFNPHASLTASHHAMYCALAEQLLICPVPACAEITAVAKFQPCQIGSQAAQLQQAPVCPSISTAVTAEACMHACIHANVIGKPLAHLPKSSRWSSQSASRR